VTSDFEEAARLVASGRPVVLVGADANALGRFLAASTDEAARERLAGVLVGDPADPTVVEAAREMAAELWPWARPAGPG